MINGIVQVTILCIWIPLSFFYPSNISNLALYFFMHVWIGTSTVYPYWLTIKEMKMKRIEQNRKEVDAMELKDILAIPKGFHEFYNYLKN